MNYIVIAAAVFFAVVHLADCAGTIAFTTLGRSRYNFDIFSLPLTTTTTTIASNQELQLTDGVSVNYNGFFHPNAPSSLIHVSERNGAANIYLTSRDSPIPFTLPLLQPPHLPPFSLKDRPSLSGDTLIYVSTHRPHHSPRQSWAAVYSTHLPTSTSKRLTPDGVADFSPTVSPSGDWTAVASSGERGWDGEVQDLHTDIYVFRTDDGSMRSKLIDHGGWPCWADESTLYFHRQSDDGWWSVYLAMISWDISPVVVAVERITPPGFHAFTPAASVGSPGIVAVATRRGDSEYRHIEIVVVRGGGNDYVEVTRSISPHLHHYNPFISPGGARIGYHRCRGGGNGDPALLLESIKSPFPEAFSLFRIDGSFPSFSHDGRRIAYVGLPGLYVVNSDGSGDARKVFDGNAFPTAWDWWREGVIYTSIGPDFAAVSTKVDIVSVSIGEDGDENTEPLMKKLTSGGENNAFPSPSPDGKWLVFRSGRSGHKNLYIADAVEGEGGGIRRLTEGPWSDTMCNWSPDGEWIAFASDRDDPGSGGFAIYMVHPNLKTSKLLEDMARRGVRYVDCYGVDNVLVRVADPIFLGYFIDKGVSAAAKVVRKAYPQEKVGVFVQRGRGGPLTVVEYSEMDPSMVAEINQTTGRLRYCWSNVCLHMFTLDFLNQVANGLEKDSIYHLAEKKIPSVHDCTMGLKLEQFIFDAFAYSPSTALFEVLREEEFAPVKNANGASYDTPDSARLMLLRLHSRWVVAAGGFLTHSVPLYLTGVEISPLCSYGGENLEAICRGRTFHAPSEITF